MVRRPDDWIVLASEDLWNDVCPIAAEVDLSTDALYAHFRASSVTRRFSIVRVAGASFMLAHAER